MAYKLKDAFKKPNNGKVPEHGALEHWLIDKIKSYGCRKRSRKLGHQVNIHNGVELYLVIRFKVFSFNE